MVMVQACRMEFPSRKHTDNHDPHVRPCTVYNIRPAVFRYVSLWRYVAIFCAYAYAPCYASQCRSRWTHQFICLLVIKLWGLCYNSLCTGYTTTKHKKITAKLCSFHIISSMTCCPIGAHSVFYSRTWCSMVGVLAEQRWLDLILFSEPRTESVLKLPILLVVNSTLLDLCAKLARKVCSYAQF